MCLVANSVEEQDLSQSLRLVGAQTPRHHGLSGQGVRIGIIDTGIDFNHPDLNGYGKSGRVAGGYDYVDPSQTPIDTNGHGTEVAGIIGANGSFSGIAPMSRLFSYKVSSTGEAVSSEYIIQAISRAIDDRVDVINISLGVNRTNDDLESAVDGAVRSGTVVVAAAGNNGPDDRTIGSPGSDYNAITVGASYNNMTSSLAATLDIGNKSYNVLPMAGSGVLESPVHGKIIYGGYGRTKDLSSLDVKDSILLEQRGSDTRGEKVFFSEKEKNAADLGARGLIIFNNQSGIFFGELVGPNATKGYHPRIPVISMSGDDGQELIKSLKENPSGTLDILYHPDFVAPFSSRGPVSPFYVKPDLVAPGVYVNTTTFDGKYNLTSGTSIATPHVTGAVALLLQKHPGLDPSSVASLIDTTTDPVTDAYGNTFPVDVAGSGRLNITRATSAGLVITPHELVFDLSYDSPSETRSLHLRPIDSSAMPRLGVQFSSANGDLGFEYTVSNETINAKVSDKAKKQGDYYGFILVDDSSTLYRIPVLVHVTRGTLAATQDGGKAGFSIDYPDKWSYAKISLTRAGTHDTKTVGITPQDARTIAIHDAGEYWAEADISAGNKTEHAYKTFVATSVPDYFDIEDALHIPLKQTVAIFAILGIASAAGLLARHRQSQV